MKTLATCGLEEMDCRDCQTAQCCEIMKCAKSRNLNYCAYCREYPCTKCENPSELLDKIKQAHALVNNSAVAYLSSINSDGYPESRAMLKLEVDGLETIWFSTNTSSPKVPQFQQNPRASVLYTNNDIYQGVTLIGDMEVLLDQQSKSRFWKEGFEIYYPKGKTDPDYCILKFTTKWVSYFKDELFQFAIPGSGE